MSGRRWRDDERPIKSEPASAQHHSAISPVMAASFASASSNPHVIELLAPLYAAVPCADGEVSVHAVTLRRTGDDWLQIVFPELSRPGKIVAMDVACVNRDAGGCRCDFVRLLRSVLVLTERQVLRVTTKYVVASAAAVADASGGDVLRMATLQLFVAIHERVSKSNAASLPEFALVLSHLQSGLMAVKTKRDGNRVLQTVESARHSRCHVVGCDLHPMGPLGQERVTKPRFTLDEVFQQLTTYVEVEQMPIRDDATYVARMKRARRDLLLTDLPIPALHSFIRMLGARDLAAMSAVSTTFQHLAYEVVPGLKLLLYSHQRKALRWLLYREGSSREKLETMPHPFVFPTSLVLPTTNPQDERTERQVIDLIEGRLVRQPTVSPAADIRGGLFCDEPGLGKTITMLALILRTKGQRSDPREPGMADRQSRRASISLRSSGSRGRELDTQKLVSSATSLIVVPNPLIDHWKYQIATHLTHGVLKVYVDDLEFKSELPSPEELATYDIVITSFGRLTHEWKFRRPKSALEERRPDRYGYEDGPDRFIDGFVNRGTSPLLMVHWVRVIVDEGHKLGGTHPTYHMRMARLFHADKRWVMTGTPTPNTLQSADLRHMHGLLVFLRDRPYGETDGKAWLKAIAKPFEQNERAGYVRLLHLLNRIMMRHTKDSIQALIPSPVRHIVYVDPTPREYAMYNGVAAAVRANLVITNKDPHTPGKLHPDSLLNPIHYRWAKQVTGNLRLATCGGGQIKATLTRESFAETVNMLNMHGVDPDRVAKAIEFMRKAENIDFLSLCTLCGRHLQLLMLIPCGHMACADCVESRVEEVGPSCGICNASYDWEIFQMLQPGFEFGNVDEGWDYDATPTPGDGGAVANGTGAGNAAGNRPPGQGQQQRRRGGRNDGSTIPVRERNGNRQRIIPIDLSRFVTVNASKAFYVASRITELRKELAEARKNELKQGSHWEIAKRPKVVKAIIFSQFKEHIWRVKVALAQQGIQCADFITGVTPAMRMEGLLKFRNDPNSNVLVLTDVGSHGLDLSFVTHIFLMDEIWDKSLEKQVVSRAHRMGAQHSVVVEQILMRASVEEIMHEMNKREAAQHARGGAEEGVHDNGEDRSATTAPLRHKSGSRAMKGFFAGENKQKGNRQKHRHGAPQTPSSQSDSQGKSSIQHRQLQRLLQSLRLIEESEVAEFGFVKFKVLDNDGELVRKASLRLSNPGKPPASLNSRAPGPSNPSPGTPVTTATTVPNSSPTTTGRRPVVHTHTHVTATAPAAVPRASSSSTSVASSQPSCGGAKAKHQVKKVRIKFEEPAAPARPPVPRGSNSGAVIDLTSDGDSDNDLPPIKTSPHSPHRRVGAPQQYVSSFYKASSEEDDVDESETEDEWAPVKREPVQTPRSRTAPAQTPTKASGKRKRQRVIIEEDDDEETDDDDGDDGVTAHAVVLRRRGDAVEIVFPELSRPRDLRVVEAACVNAAAGTCVCEFAPLLRGVLLLVEQRVLRVTAKYVVSSAAVVSPPATDGGDGVQARGGSRLATLQLSVVLHERVASETLASLADPSVDLVLSHLQAGLAADKCTRDGRRVLATVEVARRSRCHVVGCDSHPMESVDAQPKPAHTSRFPLDAVFHRLTTHSQIVPGLKSVLYAHQRTGLQWLLHRERASRRELTEATPHPFVFPAVSPRDAGGVPQRHVLDLIDRRLVKIADVMPAADMRGGLFCDEPGLGKTITMLALILKTKGERTNPQEIRADPLSERRRKGSLRIRRASSGRELDPQKLTASAATLLVVPNALIHHWYFQIEMHLARGSLRVFFDDVEYKTTLPTPEMLASYDVVVTSFGRLSDHWKHNKPKGASELSRPLKYGFEDGPDLFIDGNVNRGTSPLLLVHWARIVVDEGHKLGGTQPANHMCLARLLRADKRWVMTGTPTPNTLYSGDLRTMHGLLEFLRYLPYGEPGGKTWVKTIARPFEADRHEGYLRLLRLLSRLMLRHTKASILELIPPPTRHVAIVDPTPSEYRVYNGVVVGVRANLVLTTNYSKPSMRISADSLLHLNNAWHARIAIRNIRYTTAGGGHVQAQLSSEDFVDTVNLLLEHGVDPRRVEQIIEFMERAQTPDGLSECGACGRHLVLLMVIPCGHLTCADCVQARIETFDPSCGVCNTRYDWELFQRMQPGFFIKVSEEDWQWEKAPEGVKGFIANDFTRYPTVDASKVFYIATRIKALRREFHSAARSQAARSRPLKVIIFSQFVDHILIARVVLAQRGIQCAGFFGGVKPADRIDGVARFRNDPSINVLLLTEVGSHGLDLSFVTHIFLMDVIWDKSLEKQVVSRAHRMGAQGFVVVEQILMRGSLEEAIYRINNPRDAAWVGQITAGRRDHEREPTSVERDSSIRYLLRTLRLMDERCVASYGFVWYKVFDDEGNVVREANERVLGPSDTPTTRNHSNETTREATSRVGEVPPAPPPNPSPDSNARLLPSRASASAIPVASAVAAPQPAEDRGPTRDEQVRIKREPRQSLTREEARQQRLNPVVVDLTRGSGSDSSSDNDESAHATKALQGLQEYIEKTSAADGNEVEQDNHSNHEEASSDDGSSSDGESTSLHGDEPQFESSTHSTSSDESNDESDDDDDDNDDEKAAPVDDRCTAPVNEIRPRIWRTGRLPRVIFDDDVDAATP